MSESATLTAARIPTVYFIDDSATMREVIKIAFRRKIFTWSPAPMPLRRSLNSMTTTPNAVITDVIMPDKDGYEVCQFIKQHERFGGTPVILMSGVVNRTVAEKAMAVRADELIRKPFQPQDLIARVKNLLNPKAARSHSIESATDESPDAPKPSSQALSGLFSPASAPAPSPAQSVAPPAPRPMNAPVAVPAPRPAAAAPVARLRVRPHRSPRLLPQLHPRNCRNCATKFAASSFSSRNCRPNSKPSTSTAKLWNRTSKRCRIPSSAVSRAPAHWTHAADRSGRNHPALSLGSRAPVHISRVLSTAGIRAPHRSRRGLLPPPHNSSSAFPRRRSFRPARAMAARSSGWRARVSSRTIGTAS